MNIFEITIQRSGGDGWPVIVEQSDADRLTPQRDEGLLQIDEARLLALDFDPQEYGRALGEALFQGPVGDAFRRALARAEDRLRVLLFVEATELLDLRWERLCAPIDDGWQLLAISQRAPFSRYLPSLTDRRFPPMGRQDLRALIAVASPPPGNRFQLPTFDAVAAFTGVQAALGGIPSTVLADREGAAGSPTIDAICERITAEPYTVLHIVCHGVALDDGESALYLTGPGGPESVEPVTATRLIERLGNLQGARGLPRLIFLAACESASPQADEALGGLAQRLVRELGVPAVVAMADRVEVTTANDLAAAFYSRLIEHGEVDRALVEATAGLAERGDVMVPVLFSRLGGRPLFSEAGDRPLSGAEIGAGLGRLQPLIAARAPVLVAELDRAAGELRRTIDVDPAALAPEARRERAAALDVIDALCAEAVEMRFADLAGGKAPPAYDDRCPFPGLRAFASDLRAFFFGREALVTRLAGRLAEHPALAVLGASGSGKSSAVFAGLVPALQAARPELLVLTMTPGAQPLASLSAARAKAPPGAGAAGTLLIVDQFEEAFTLCADAGERQAFFDALLALPPDHTLVLTMRADFWGEVAPYPRLRELMQAHQELVAPMSPDELRRAMELQAAAVGLRFEADLAGQILDDVRGEPGAMPLLQHALAELWKRRRGRWLRGAEYRAIGGIHQAIAHTADAIYAAAAPPERERLRDIFVRLTRIDRAEAGGDERRDTRQRVAFAELVPAGADPTPVRELVRRLADARLVVTGVAAGGGETVEVAHEALIRSWPRLRGWLEEDRQSLLLRDAIRQAALEWSREGHDEDLLFRGSRLDDALALGRVPRFAPNELERSFLDAAVELREREESARDEQRRRELEQAQALAAEQQRRAEESAAAARQLRSRAVFLAGVAVVALVAMVAAGIFGWQSQQAEARAEVSAAEARARALAANARAAQAFGQPDLALAIAIEAAAATPPLPESFNTLAAIAENAARWKHQGFRPIANVFFMPQGQMIGVIEGLNWHSALRFLTPDGQPASFALGPVRDPREAMMVTGDQPTLATLSPDGDSLFAYFHGYGDGEVSNAIIWGLSGGSVVRDPRQLLVGAAPASHAVFHPAGGEVILATEDGRLARIDVLAERVTGLIELAPDAPSDLVLELPEGTPVPQFAGLAISPDGKAIAILRPDARVRLLSFADGAEQRVLDDQRGGSETKLFAGLAYSPDGSRLAAAGPGGTVRVWAIGEEGRPRVLNHDGAVRAVAYSPDGALLAVGLDDGRIRMWDVAAGAALRNYQGHSGAITALAFSPDGRTLLSGSSDLTARLWDASSGFLVAGAPGSPTAAGEPPPRVAQVAFGAADLPLIRDEAGMLRSWDPAGAQALNLFGEASGLTALDVSGAAARALVYDPAQGELQVWATDQAGKVAGFPAPGGPPLNARILPGAEQFFSVEPDGRILVRSLADGATVREIEQPMGVWKLALSADGSRAAGIAFSSEMTDFEVVNTLQLAVWDVGTGKLVVGLTEKVPAVPFSIALSPDGATIAFGMSDNTVQLRRASDGAVVQKLLGHVGPVQAVMFTPDGALLVTGGGDRTLRLWDLAAGTELRAFSVAPRDPVSLALSGSGDRLLVGDVAGGATLWRIESGSALVDWARANRFSAELSCADRERYRLDPCPPAPEPTPTPAAP